MNATLSLPPLYRPVILAGGGADALAHAHELAGNGAEAGVFAWRPDRDRLDCAVVLRPDDPKQQVRPVVLAAALALSDAIGSVGPPAVATDLVWPGTVRVNRGVVGGVAVELGPSAGPHDVPEWALLGADVRIAAEPGIEGGERLDVTSLAAEGFGAVAASALAESFARYLLVWTDRWQDGGLPALARHWLHRATAQGRDTVLMIGDALLAGTIECLDESGGLVLETSDGRRTLSLADAMP